MLKEFCEYLQGMKPEIFDIDGRKYTSGSLSKIAEPKPETLKVSNLESLVRYILDYGGNDCDGIVDDKQKLLVCVESPTKVSIYSKWLKGHVPRIKYLTAEARELNIRGIGHFLRQDEFVISMRSCFTPVGDRDIVLQIAGNTTDVDETVYHDDGVGQTVKSKVGVDIQRTNLPSSVKLAPYRTFTAVEQPVSEFILRVEKGGQFALFEADGGAWWNQAMENIRQYLEEKLKGMPVVIIG